jgi:hypothetical protein
VTFQGQLQHGCPEISIVQKEETVGSGILEDACTELRKMGRPNIVTSHYPGQSGTICVIFMQGFPPELKSFLQIALIVWIVVPAEERGVTFEIRGFAHVQLSTSDL